MRDDALGDPVQAPKLHMIGRSQCILGSRLLQQLLILRLRGTFNLVGRDQIDGLALGRRLLSAFRCRLHAHRPQCSKRKEARRDPA